MDLDDKLFHYLLWFGGMTLASMMHKIADAWGEDVVKGLKWVWHKIVKKKD